MTAVFRPYAGPRSEAVQKEVLGTGRVRVLEGRLLPCDPATTPANVALTAEQ
jgi:hypothetical protein